MTQSLTNSFKNVVTKEEIAILWAISSCDTF